ncbi:DUF3429 domain-containing protein [Limnobacter parvus]|uniref:DUF3429 domain-containing protein n=1 Tax=Limnobacter parvus TaxID=2939690 RepID=A0ABT1XCL7_9BURK|nr:DUF3429 domain-containing protein [Limnobacter parvus]MCR2745031.1 DUF3429 domain-containing protein [Limnobacter parvus]
MTQALKTHWMSTLGYGGLIPFLGLAVLTGVYSGTDTAAELARYNMVYALCIVSFLGAVHWGLAISLSSSPPKPGFLGGVDQAEFETRSFIWGVTPSLLAWLAGAFSPAQHTLWILGGVLAFVWLVDQHLLKPMKAFDSYLKLRNHLTAGAILGLLITACFV